MIKDHILLEEKAKNKIFIFDAYGKLYKIIDLASTQNPILDSNAKHEKWRLVAFNSEEDLVMMTIDGRIFIIDIIQEKCKDKITIQESLNISAAKLECAHNTLVFRTIDCQFYYIPNVVSNMTPLIQPSKFVSIPRFEKLGNKDNISFTVVPK